MRLGAVFTAMVMDRPVDQPPASELSEADIVSMLKATTLDNGHRIHRACLSLGIPTFPLRTDHDLQWAMARHVKTGTSFILRLQDRTLVSKGRPAVGLT